MEFLRKNLSIYTLYLVMILTAYLYGGLRLISIFSLFTVSLAAFIFAFYPFNTLEKSNKNLKKLLKFPPFYFCIFFSLYVLIQILNPSANMVKLDGGFSCNLLEYNKLLPSGILSEYIDKSIFEAFLSMLSVFFAMLTVWLSFRNFKKLNNLCLVASYAGTLLAILSILNYALPSLGIFSYIDKSIYNPSGSFFYHAHGNAFFICILGFIGIAIANSISFKNSWKNSSLILILCLFIVAFAITISGGATGALLAAFIVPSILINAVFAFKKSKRLPIFISLSLCSVIAIALLFALIQTSSAMQNAFKRISSRTENLSAHFENRNSIKKVSLDMISSGGDFSVFEKKSKPDYSKIIFGRGLNSYEPLSESYSIYNNPSFMHYNAWATQKKTSRTIKFAHCDPLQVTFEFGLLGISIIGIWILWYIISLCKTGRKNFNLIASGLISMIAIIAYSFNDNIFYNPFVALNFAVLSIVVFALKSSLQNPAKND